MVDLEESGFRTTSVIIDYDARRLEAVRDELNDGWNTLLKGDPQPQEPRGFKFIFRDPTGMEPFALVKQDATEVNHPIANSEQTVAEICGRLLSSDHLRPRDIVIIQGTPLHLYQVGQDFDLPLAIRESRSALSFQIADDLDSDVRRTGSSYRFHLSGTTYILDLTTDPGPPASVECALRGHYDGLKSEESVEEALMNHRELLQRLTPKVAEVVSSF